MVDNTLQSLNIPDAANFGSSLTDFNGAFRFAEIISTSDMCPKDCRGKAGDILLRLQLGAEIGLKPMQSIQNIAVINGRPTVWGDAALAIVMNHPEFDDIKETYDASTEEATCIVKRYNKEECQRTFSKDDAKKAGLLSKPGVWQTYPKRMLQMRARSFAIRDSFADALKGLNVREEIEDYRPIRNINNYVELDDEPPVQQLENGKDDSLKKELVEKVKEAISAKQITPDQISKMLAKAEIDNIDQFSMSQLEAIAEKYIKEGL